MLRRVEVRCSGFENALEKYRVSLCVAGISIDASV